MDNMTVEAVLNRYLAERGLSRADTWLYLLIGDLRVPYVPLAPFRRFLAIHDLHHIITGYSTSLHDEICLIGWELMSGGWGRNNWWYFGKSINILWILVINPLGMWRALRDGWRCRNLHRYELEEVLRMEYSDALGLVRRNARAEGT